MRLARPRADGLARMALVAVALLLLAERGVTQGGPGRSAESVRIALPSSITFYVTDLNAVTPAAAPTVITFDNLIVRQGRGLRISVRSEANRFTPPFGVAIPVADVTWRATGALAGVGLNGTLSRNWEDVFQGVENGTNGEVTLSWALDPPPPSLAAGLHTVTLRWRLRAVNP
jgi:hypothetical protein